MMGLPHGARVWLACGVTDMRRYVEFSVMRSRRASGVPGLV